MTFEEHLANSRGADGLLQIDVAVETRTAEVAAEMADPGARLEYARKVARRERDSWRKREQVNLAKAVGFAALSPELEAVADVKVQLGGSRAVEYVAMNGVRIRQRMEMREKVHRGEQRAYVDEMDHWDQTLGQLDGDETIGEALDRFHPPQQS